MQAQNISILDKIKNFYENTDKTMFFSGLAIIIIILFYFVNQSYDNRFNKNTSTKFYNNLSEETEDVNFEEHNDFLWIVDPLDGTVNYLRNISHCAISIALYKNKKPIFGVIGEYPSGSISWGGPKIGSYTNSQRITVSNISRKSNSILCTGFPARYKFNSSNEKKLFKLASGFAKVRMLGSASISILKIAQGSAEYYDEKNIMIWDIAAGIAILCGSGGKYSMLNGDHPNSFNVKATNGLLK